MSIPFTQKAKQIRTKEHGSVELHDLNSVMAFQMGSIRLWTEHCTYIAAPLRGGHYYSGGDRPCGSSLHRLL